MVEDAAEVSSSNDGSSECFQPARDDQDNKNKECQKCKTRATTLSAILYPSLII